MKTIEERAKENRSSQENKYGVTDLIGLEDGYIQGALAQREIDIEHACEWLVANGYFLVGHREIKDFKQAMKGE